MKHIVLKKEATSKLLNELKGLLLVKKPNKSLTNEEVVEYALNAGLEKIRG
jgi:hypothetical protein